jgi:hypothetical protein
MSLMVKHREINMSYHALMFDGLVDVVKYAGVNSMWL